MDSHDAHLTKIQRHESYLETDPTNINLAIELGDLYHQAGRFDDALNCFSRALAAAPSLTIGKSRTAAVYLSQHRFSDAGAILSALIAEGEVDAALFHNLGLALFYQDQFAEAAENFYAAEKRHFTAATNYKFLSYCLHHAGKLEEAVSVCEKWVKADNSLEGKAYLSLLAYDSGERDQANRIARQILTEQPENIDANAVVGGMALEAFDIETARRSFEQILLHRPDYGRAWLGLGLVNLHQEKNAQAIAAITRAVEEMPNHAGTIVSLGWAKLIAFDAAGAEAAFRQAIGADRNFAESHGGLAVALIYLSRLDEAKRELQIADRLNPSNFGSVYAKALMLKLGGESGAADRLISRALRQAPIEGEKPLFDYLAKFLGRPNGR